MIGRTATGLTITPLGYPTHKAHNWMICVRHEAHCYIARVAGMDWRRCLWI